MSRQVALIKASREADAFGVEHTKVEYKVHDENGVEVFHGNEFFPLSLSAEEVKNELLKKQAALEVDETHAALNAKRDEEHRLNDATLAALNGEDKK